MKIIVSWKGGQPDSEVELADDGSDLLSALARTRGSHDEKESDGHHGQQEEEGHHCRQQEIAADQKAGGGIREFFPNLSRTGSRR
jgi:hypothetical protein